MKILRDAEEYPSCFFWYGAVSSSDLLSWQNERRLKIPNDLLRLWQETGGGDLFETETIVGPQKNGEWADDFDSVNDLHWRKGMPKGFAVFHIGVVLSAFRLRDSRYVILDQESYTVLREYDTLDEWYEKELRAEYESRYGLP